MPPFASLPYEVRCPMHGSIPFNEREARIIDHPLYQVPLCLIRRREDFHSCWNAIHCEKSVYDLSPLFSKVVESRAYEYLITLFHSSRLREYLLSVT